MVYRNPYSGYGGEYRGGAGEYGGYSEEYTTEYSQGGEARERYYGAQVRPLSDRPAWRHAMPGYVILSYCHTLTIAYHTTKYYFIPLKPYHLCR